MKKFLALLLAFFAQGAYGAQKVKTKDVLYPIFVQHKIDLKKFEAVREWAESHRAVVQKNEINKKAEKIKNNACLVVAVYQNQPELVREYVQKGANVNIKLEHANSLFDDLPLLLWALFFSDYVKCVEELLNGNGWDYLLALHDDKEDLTAFMVLAMHNSVAGMRLFCRKGVNINEQDKAGNSALWHAVYRKNEAAIRFLLSCPDIDLNLQNGDKKTVLEYAVQHSQEDLVYWLINCDQWEALAQETKNRAVTIAVQREYNRIMRLLLLAGGKYISDLQLTDIKQKRLQSDTRSNSSNSEADIPSSRVSSPSDTKTPEFHSGVSEFSMGFPEYQV